jgi:hypothetical protein
MLSGWTGHTGRQGFGRAAAFALIISGSLAALAGCNSDKPHDYGQERPSVRDLDRRDSGLQSRDIQEAADQMAGDLLNDPQLNASREQWTMVVVNMEDKTRGQMQPTDFDLFLQALKGRLAQQGRGRVQLIANRAKFYQQRDQELEGGGGRDPYGQTGRTGPAAAPDAISPDYFLSGVARNLPRRGTDYYQIEFTVTNAHNRAEVWDRVYAVKVAR